MEGAELKIDVTALKNLIRQLGNKKEVQVGIFKENNARADGKSNAEIGFKHEFGDPEEKLPMRSWLREPILEKGQQLADVVNESLSEDLNLDNAYQALVVEAEKIVKGGFESGGYGKWKKLSPRTIAEKGNDKILVEKGYLEESVKSKVVKL